MGYRVGNIYVIATVAVVGGGLFGFDISSLSAQLGENAYKCYFNQGPNGPPFNDNPNCTGPASGVQGGITAAMAGGSWLGALISGTLSDRLGRKWSIMAGCIVWLVLFSLRWILASNLRQDGRFNNYLRFSKYRYAHRRTHHQRSCSRCRISSSPSLYFRTGSTFTTRPLCRFTAMGNHLGNSYHVLVSHSQHSNHQYGIGY
jgi:MFS family permease